MTVVQEYEPEAFRVWRGEALMGPGGQTISAPIVVGDVWTDTELAAVGLYRVAPFVPPQGYIAVGEPSYSRVGGKVLETYATDLTPPPDPEIARKQLFADDTVVQELAAHLKEDPATIEAWVRGRLNSAAVVDLETARAYCARVETAFVQVVKALVLLGRKI